MAAADTAVGVASAKVSGATTLMASCDMAAAARALLSGVGANHACPDGAVAGDALSRVSSIAGINGAQTMLGTSLKGEEAVPKKKGP